MKNKTFLFILLLLFVLASCSYNYPIPGGEGLLVVEEVTSTSVTISWEPAASYKGSLSYNVYYAQQPGIDTQEALDAYALPTGEYEAEITRRTVGNLTPDTQYYFNVVVCNGFYACYNSIGARTNPN